MAEQATLERIAVALERIATVLEKQAEHAIRVTDLLMEQEGDLAVED